MAQDYNRQYRIGQGGFLLVTASLTLNPNNLPEMILVDATAGPVTIVLPPSTGIGGKIFFVKKTDASGNAVTLDGDGSETIDGNATVSLPNQFDALVITCDNENWQVTALGD